MRQCLLIKIDSIMRLYRYMYRRFYNHYLITEHAYEGASYQTFFGIS